MIAGTLLLSLSGLLYLPAAGLAGVIVARLVVGVGEGGLYTAGSAWIVDIAPLARRGRVLGLYGLAVWGALSVGPLIGEVTLQAGGYRAVWILAAALPAIGVLIATSIPDPFRLLAHAEPHPLISREAIRPGVAIALASAGYAALASFVVLHLEDRGIGHGALVFAAFATMLVLARVVAGDLPDRMGPTRVALVSALVEAAALLAIAFAHTLVIALLGAMAMGAAFSLLNPSLMLIAVHDVSEDARGAAMGTYTAFFDAGVGIGAPIAGLAAALSGYEGAFILAAAISASSAALILTTLHRRTQRPLTNSV